MPKVRLWRARHAAVVALLPALFACSSDTVEPSGRTLIGDWGSSDAELIAIQAGAEVRFGCSTIVIRAPIALSEANTFETQGEFHGSGLRLGEFPVVSVTGSVDGARVRLTAPTEDDGGPLATYVLEAGATPLPSDVPECPL